MLGLLEGSPAKLQLVEAHRFEHMVLDMPTGPCWDYTSLWREVQQGVRKAAKMATDMGVELKSIGVDTWGVDWTMVDTAGEPIGLPHAYRDPAHGAAMRGVLDRFPGGVEAIYGRTGIAPATFNTLFQLEARYEASPTLFEIMGGTMLLMPDLMHFLLTGKMANERTIASTTSMLNAETGTWDTELLSLLGLPSTQLAQIVEPGTVLGPVRDSLVEELGLPGDVQVVAPAGHDTASAVAAVPATEPDGTWAYLSSGTWSLLGVEAAVPNTTPAAFAVPFTNEQGVGGKIRFLRNIGGLWLVQELRRDLQKQGQSFDFAQLAALASEAEPLRSIVDPNAGDLAQPGDSIAKLRGHAARTGQPEPETPGQLARCCLESLALCYNETITQIESLTDCKIETLHIVGGGVNNRLLNQLTADATGRTVKLGPSEATAIGNALVQAMGLGIVDGLANLREIVGRFSGSEVIEPSSDPAEWSAAKERYQQLIGG